VIGDKHLYLEEEVLKTRFIFSASLCFECHFGRFGQ
jgi:hypothetical protein